MTRVMVARPRSQLASAVQYLESRGIEVAAVPLIDLVPRTDGSVERAIARIVGREADAVVFTSQNGVRFVLDRATEPRAFLAGLDAVEVVAVGPKTAAALQQAGIGHALVPATYSSEGIVGELGERLAGKRVEVLRSDRGDPRLLSGLRARGARVNETIVYDILPVDGEAQRRLVTEALSGQIDAYMFTSVMTVKSLLAIADTPGMAADLKAAINMATVAAIGHPTERYLRAEGIRIDVIPERFTFEDMVDALLKYLERPQ